MLIVDMIFGTNYFYYCHTWLPSTYFAVLAVPSGRATDRVLKELHAKMEYFLSQISFS